MRSIEGQAVKGKRVLVRVGFDLSLDERGNIEPGAETRLNEGLPTLEWLISQGAALVLLNHLGRPKARELKFSNRKIAELLAARLGRAVKFSEQIIGETLEAQSQNLKPGEILFVENTRFDEREKKNDPEFARALARLGDIYVNDAFSAAYNVHASLVAITEFLPSFAGFLLIKEVAMMDKLIKNPARPLVAILGGAKIDTKIGLIKRFLEEADHLLLGGALANTILHMQGVAVGKSIVDLAAVELVKDLDLTSPKLHIPVDAIVSNDASGKAPSRVAPIGRIGEDELILDIGPDSRRLYDAVIKTAKTVIWNGPMGKVEAEPFAQGTIAIVSSIKSSGAFSVTGGGDSLAFLASRDLTAAINYISTGGGAMLEYLSGKRLSAIGKLR